MFITDKAFLSPVSAFFCEQGQSGWVAAEVAMHQNWFLAYFEQKDSNSDNAFSCNRTMLFTDFKAVEQLLLEGREQGARLKSVHILTPGHVNGTDSWKMDRIGAVWLGREPHPEYIPVDIFETTTGEKYPAFHLGISADAMQIDALKFKFDA